MNATSRKLVWAFAVLVLLSVLLTFYKSVILEEFTVVYCDEERNCYRTIPEEWSEEEEVEEVGALDEADPPLTGDAVTGVEAEASQEEMLE